MKTQNSSPYSSHAEVWSLLPWYINGRLGLAEREQVKAHIQVCLLCRKELAEQSVLAKHLQHEPQVEISPMPSFERLMARIQAGEELADHSTPASPALHNRRATDRQPPTPSVAQVSGKSRLPGWLHHWFTAVQTGFEPKTVAWVCSALLLALCLPLITTINEKSGPSLYHTVADQGSLDGFSTSDLRVVFAEQTPDEEINRLVHAVNGGIVDGPNAAGVYTIRLASGKDESASLPKALAGLRGSQSVVFAEPALPQPEQVRQGGGK